MNQEVRSMRGGLTGKSKQDGATLIEILIGLALSLVVTSSMVMLMSNSLGTTTRVIEMTQLTDELRNTMSMLTRDLRRANYSANAAYCYANADCGLDGSANQVELFFSDSCITFNLDRDQNGDATTDNAGGFRKPVGVNVIEMWTGDASPDCDAVAGAAGWLEITDPDLVDITDLTFTLVDLTGNVSGGGGATLTQHTREISIALEGALRLEGPVPISRRIEDTIKVRNDFLQYTPPAP